MSKPSRPRRNNDSAFLVPRRARTGKPLFYPQSDSATLRLMSAGLGGTERQCLDVITYFMTTYGPPLRDPQPISITTFVRMANLPRTNVIRALKSLEAKGVIQVKGEGRGDRLHHGRKTSCYGLAPLDAWKVGSAASGTEGSVANGTEAVPPAVLQVSQPSIQKRENERDEATTPRPVTSGTQHDAGSAQQGNKREGRASLRNDGQRATIPEQPAVSKKNVWVHDGMCACQDCLARDFHQPDGRFAWQQEKVPA